MDEIDALLDKEFNLTEDLDEETPEETEEETSEDNEEENSEEEAQNNEVDDTNNSDTNQDTDEKSNQETTKPTKEAKEQNAFAELRSRANAEKQRADKEVEFIKDLAASYGYTDVDKFKTDVKRARMEKEAEAKGIDKNIYIQLQQQQERITQLEKEKEEREVNIKIEAFKSSIENAENNYGVKRDLIFERLENAGYSVDDVIASPNIDLVIKGLLVDEIAKKSQQEQLKDIKNLDGLTDEKHNSSNGEKQLSLEDIIKAEMKQYKEENYL